MISADLEYVIAAGQWIAPLVAIDDLDVLALKSIFFCDVLQ
jgi:hypothetical protein